MIKAEDFGRSGIEKIIDEWVIGKNGERDRLIMKLHFINGYTFEGLQKKLDTMEDESFHLSIDRLKQIILQRSNQIEKHITITNMAG